MIKITFDEKACHALYPKTFDLPVVVSLPDPHSQERTQRISLLNFAELDVGKARVPAKQARPVIHDRYGTAAYLGTICGAPMKDTPCV